MATTQEYINQLKIDKQNLVNMLNTMGVEANENETFTALAPKVGTIVTDPILQDKNIEVTENGTQEVTADAGYNGLNKVSITTNVKSSGGEVEKGFIVNAWDSNGYATKVTVKGISTVPSYYLFGGANASGLTSKMKELTFEGVTSVSSWACRYCRSLITVNMPSTLTTLGNYVFDDCNVMKKINLDYVTKIGNACFNTCTSLIQVCLANINQINGDSTSNAGFNGCSKLKAVWIGSKVTSLPRYAFHGCSALTKMYIDLPRATVEAMAAYSYGFRNVSGGYNIIVCNDDAGFMTKDQFNSTDWSTYTG